MIQNIIPWLIPNQSYMVTASLVSAEFFQTHQRYHQVKFHFLLYLRLCDLLRAIFDFVIFSD